MLTKICGELKSVLHTRKVLWQQPKWWRSFLFQEDHRKASWEAASKTNAVETKSSSVGH